MYASPMVLIFDAVATEDEVEILETKSSSFTRSAGERTSAMAEKFLKSLKSTLTCG